MEAQERLSRLVSEILAHPERAAYSDVLLQGSDLLLGVYRSHANATEGTSLCHQLLAALPEHEEFYEELARLEFPGEDYLRILREIHAARKPKFYLEIGVFEGASLSLVQETTVGAGVDPAPQIKHKIPRNVRVFVETSDEFFAEYGERVGEQKIDLAFIDGLHHFEQTLRDFINVENRASPNGLVIIHDCIPFNEASSSRERHTGFWTGDVWKCLAILMDYRADLDIQVIGTAPSGLVLVRGLDVNSGVLADQFNSLVAGYMDLTFADWKRSYAPRIHPIVSNPTDVAQNVASE
jgi:methyltransferase family protein